MLDRIREICHVEPKEGQKHFELIISCDSVDGEEDEFAAFPTVLYKS